MNFNTPFVLFLALSMVGWLALFLFPRSRAVNWWLCGTIIPAIIAAFYTACCILWWNTSSVPSLQRFTSHENLRAMFHQSGGLLLAGYVHYLCFDLFLGAWEARRATAQRWPYPLLLVTLIVTLLFGPTGLLLFLIISAARGQWIPGNEVRA